MRAVGQQCAVRLLALAGLTLFPSLSHSQTLSVDADTTLLLRMDGNLNGVQSQSPVTATGVQYVPGLAGQGANFVAGNNVRFAAANVINATEGTLEFWIKPNWAGSNRQDNVVLAWGGAGGMLISKDGGGYWRLIANRYRTEVSVSTSISGWQAGVWRHCAFTWSPTALRLYVNGQMLDERVLSQSLPAITDAQFQLGAEGANALDAVLDELRISRRARTRDEIVASFAAGLPALGEVNLSLSTLNPRLYAGANNTPQVTLRSGENTYTLPGAACTWTSSHTGVATVSSSGYVQAVSPGAARITASLGAASASLDYTVIAAARPPLQETLDPVLTTPAPRALYEIPVLILRYVPTADGEAVDRTVTGLDALLAVDTLRARMTRHAIETKFALEMGSRFRGYAGAAAPPSLGYRVVRMITVFEELPLGRRIGTNPDLYYPDYASIVNRWSGQQAVEQEGVKEIWLWGYHHGSIVPAESKMSSPLTGDISNSLRNNEDLPVFARTYTLYTYNFTRTTGENVHNHGHHLEALLGYTANRQDGNDALFWRNFVGRKADGTFGTGRAGWTHMPPNTTVDYDYTNNTTVPSDIMDWRPDGGTEQPVHAGTWQSVWYPWPYGAAPEQPDNFWYLYWMQSMPGRGNTIPHGAKVMANWWHFTGDWDASVQAGLGLWQEPGAYAATAAATTFPAAGAASSVNVGGGRGAWSASSNATWIRLTGAIAGTGDGAVPFSLAPNSSPEPRTGTLAVAGQLVAVTQLGTAGAPVIAPVSGVVGSSSGQPFISPGAWISIFGSALSSTARSWAQADFLDGRMPTALDGVSVSINGKDAYIGYISPTQINALVPALPDVPYVTVQVRNAAGRSQSVAVDLRRAAPEVFTYGVAGTPYAIAQFSDYSLVGKPGLLGPGVTLRACRPGDVLILYATAFGLNLAGSLPEGVVPGQAYPLSGSAAAFLGATPMRVLWAGLISPGLYQLNVEVPDVPAGDHPLRLLLDNVLPGFGTAYLTVNR